MSIAKTFSHIAAKSVNGASGGSVVVSAVGAAGDYSASVKQPAGTYLSAMTVVCVTTFSDAATVTVSAGISAGDTSVVSHLHHHSHPLANGTILAAGTAQDLFQSASIANQYTVEKRDLFLNCTTDTAQTDGQVAFRVTFQQL